jgi:hypothetical protein
MNNPKNICLTLLLILSFLLPEVLSGEQMQGIFSDYLRPINDGPYIFFQGDSLLIKEIIADSIYTRKMLYTGSDTVRINPVGHWVEINNNFEQPEKNQFEEIEKFLVISDTHGQYQLFSALLRNNNIVDHNLNWIWEKGHLVINGDVFDRGEGVTESLWLIYSLQQQAEKAGGKVHFLLGNHELMIIENDLRYVDEKYIRVAYLLNSELQDMYAENTVLGRWLRTRPASLEINNNLIIHAGISPALAAKINDLNTLNRLTGLILSGSYEEESEIRLLTGSLGPFWYRGYFRTSSSYEQINQSQLEDILSQFAVDRIIVGHTSLDDIYYFYGSKLIAVDASMKLGKQGKALLYESGLFTIVDTEGNITALKEYK